MAITKASFDRANAAMETISLSYQALQLGKVTVQETGEQFVPPPALRASWQQEMADAIAVVKQEVGTW